MGAMTVVETGNAVSGNGEIAADVAMTATGPTSRPSDDATNGRVARELPFASALLIRRDIADRVRS